MKYEWKKQEKQFYQPKNKPELIDVPEFKFITIDGQGNPNDEFFGDYIGVLYSLAYAIKMNLKKLETKPNDYQDWSVYPLEGFWDIKTGSKLNSDGSINKNDLVFKLMIRQPDFVTDDFFQQMVELTNVKKPNQLLKKVKFEKIADGKSIQMMHLGSYDDEPASFAKMERLASELGLTRLSKAHREIYLSDFRKTVPEKLKTVLRFRVE